MGGRSRPEFSRCTFNHLVFVCAKHSECYQWARQIYFTSPLWLKSNPRSTRHWAAALCEVDREVLFNWAVIFSNAPISILGISAGYLH